MKNAMSKVQKDGIVSKIAPMPWNTQSKPMMSGQVTIASVKTDLNQSYSGGNSPMKVKK